MVHSGGELVTVRSLVEAKKQSDPKCKVAYHEMEEVATGVMGEFKLSTTIKVHFTPTVESDAKDNQMSFAAFIPQACWEQEGICKVVWAVRWSAQGLSPIRPLTMLLCNLTLAAGQALQIAPAPA